MRTSFRRWWTGLLRGLLAPILATSALVSMPPAMAGTSGTAGIAAGFPVPSPPAWHDVTTPAPGPAQSIGGYANGCLAGGVGLAGDGPGYQVIRLSRKRNFGHPDLVAYLSRLGLRIAAAGLGRAMIGDLSQPRGGPMPNGHASHEIGLDVDIWLRLDLPLLPPERREELVEVSMVDVPNFRINPQTWSPRQVELIHLAADDPRVTRIFVHPTIKDALCRLSWPDRAWLARVRPWFGHAAHMHIRLRCPADSPACENQPPAAPGDGCGEELASWFPKPDQPPAKPEPARPKPPPPPLPAACRALLR